MENNEIHRCQCECGESEFTLRQAPKGRFLCHCVTCQEVYAKPYADVVAVNASSVNLIKDNTIHYKNYSPALDRGICSQCNRPVISFLKFSNKLKLAFIPTAVLNKNITVPEARAHIFYHSCTKPVADEIPKISGKFKSNMKALPIIFTALFRK